jgi:polyphenol oxidase
VAKVTTPVAAGFAWRDTPAGVCLVSADLASLADHVFTTRDLQFLGGPIDPDYERLGAAFGVSGERVVRVRQVHGRVVMCVRPGEASGALSDADAIVSTDPSRVIAVRIADCVPVLLADRRGGAVAAVHAGWRGTAAGVCLAAVDALRDLGVPAGDLVAAVGPSIGPCCYQVDRAVRQAFEAAWPGAAAWFRDDGPGRWRLDLWRATVDQLLEAGLARADLHVSRLCTADHPKICYSFRKDASVGRMAAAIRLRPGNGRS